MNVTKTINQTGTGYDQGLRAYFTGVYNHMMFALLTTGFTAYISAPFLASLVGTFWWIVIAFAPLAFVFALSFGIDKMSPKVAKIVFYTYSIFMGLSFSIIFLAYTATSIAQVFFISASVFGAASLYGYITKRDLTKFGSFLFMGLVGLIVASLVNLFLASSLIMWVVSVIGVLVFTGLTAYDTQRLKEEYHTNGSVFGFDSQEKSTIYGALTMYLNFVILFQYLLSILGQKKE